MIDTLAGLALDSGVDLLKRPERSVRSRATGPFEGASVAHRMKNWMPSNQGINSMLFANGDMLRARSRDLARKNAWAAGALDSFVANVVGTGIQPEPNHPDPAMKKLLKEEFLRWTDEADAGGCTDFYGLQSQACRAVMQDGDVFGRLRYRRPGDGLRIPLQIQMLESDYCPLTANEPTATGAIYGGIEVDKLGRRLAYHMYRAHPGELNYHAGAGETVAIPASEVLHLFMLLRPGQMRGQPKFTPAIVTLHEIDQFVDATVMRQKLSNLLSGYIEGLPADDPTLEDTAGESDSPIGEVDKGDGTADATLEAGEVFRLRPGEKISFSDPPDPGANYVEFVRSMLRGVARALGITYEQLTGDLENVNYSSIRAGLFEFRRWCEAFQHQVMVYQMCRPIWAAWLEAAAMSGIIPAARLQAERLLFLDVTWQPPGWAYVNPVDDIESDKALVRSGFESRPAVIARRGGSAEQVDQENSEANRRADELGLKYDSDGRNPDGGKAASAPKDQGQAQPAKPSKLQAV